MCIIATSEIGKQLPDAVTIETMWHRNSDGAGFMYNHNGKVIIEKGFMTLKDFLKAVEELKTKIDVVNTAVVMHFRIGTHGGNIPENTHPFPITCAEPLLKKLHTSCNIGMAHNGIITSVEPRNNISDTMQYILEILAPLKKTVKDFNNNSVIQKLITETINGSRMCFLTSDGNINYIGNWVTDETTGIKYSNTTYIPVKDWWDSYAKFESITPSWASVSPVDGYAINSKTGEMHDGTEEELYVDEHGNVYLYIWESDIAIRLSDTTAFNSSGVPAVFEEEAVFDINWVFEEELEDYVFMSEDEFENLEYENNNAYTINEPVKFNDIKL